MLGGGHGWLQGRYGKMADNLISARVVLANGTAITVSEGENADLFWGLKGAGHNVGIVTSFQYKIHDRTPENENWAMDMMVFTQENLETVFQVANGMLGHNVPVELPHLSMWVFMPNVDPIKVSLRMIRYL